MNCNEILEEMKSVQENILDYLDYGSNVEERYQNIKNIFSNINIYNNRYKIKSLMYLLLRVSNNYHREENFFSKIEKILELFKEDLKKYFSNSKLFHIFKSNKRILLFLFEEEIMDFDEFIAKQIIKDKFLKFQYPQYFQPEIQPFINESWFPKYNKTYERNKWVLDIQKEIPDDFYEKRKIGENDDFICKLIQKDLIEEFITYGKKYFCPLELTIKQSIYETNLFLLKKERIYLIEYAAFYGSIQIFKYLRANKVKYYLPIFYFAIHGRDPEIFKILEKNLKKMPKKTLFDGLFKESILCHHIDISNYILDNYLPNEEDNSDQTLIDSLKYYNFAFIKNDKINEKAFYYLCKYDYCMLVFILLSTMNIDLNKIEI